MLGVDSEAWHLRSSWEQLSDGVRDGQVRKREAYGDVVAPELDAEDVATEVERYVEAVALLVEER